MKILFFIFLFYNSLLFSTDLNTSIINAEPKTYKTLLKQITDTNKASDEINLQKTLLIKLIDFSSKKPYKEDSIKIIYTPYGYLKLFDSYIEKLFAISNLQKTMQSDQEKMEALKAQIQTQTTEVFTTQLFYAFHTKEFTSYEKQLSTMQKELNGIGTKLLKTLKNISLKKETILLQEKNINSNLETTTKQIEKLLIKKERYILLGQNKAITTIEKQIKQIEQKQADFNQQKLRTLFLHFSLELQLNSEKSIQYHNQILTLLNQKIQNGKILKHPLDILMSDMEQTFLGTLKTLKTKSLQKVQNEIIIVWEIINQTLFTINKTPISLFKLFISLSIFVGGFFLGNFYKKYIKSLNTKNKPMNPGTHTIVINIGYYTIFIITFFIVLKVMGIDLSSITLVAGALSVGIGFGLQNIISNFVSGIILMFEHSVKIGDYIELDENLRGHVVDIKMRSITINTNSNIDIIVPNQDLIQNRVVNWTMNDKIRRFEIPFGVAYGTKPEKVIEVLLEAIKNENSIDLYNTQERHTRVIMTGMGNSSVDFELFVWIQGKEILFPKRTTSRFLILIYNALYANNIEIPFPQQDIHIRSIAKDSTLKFSKN